MIEQDVTNAARELGYIVIGSYPARPVLIIAQTDTGIELRTRGAALSWLAYEKRRRGSANAAINNALKAQMEQDAADNAKEY